jgi:hypothetical protein
MDSIDVCISFDTTGSMYPCLTQVRRDVDKTIKQLFGDIPDLRIAIIAHGDYCDKNRPYVTKILDFTKKVYDVSQFVNKVKSTDGGDAAECYELVLHQARTKLKWKSGRAKVLVMIGDDVPHQVGYRCYGMGKANEIDWRNELGLLVEAGINVYGVHAMPGCRRHSKPFYTEIARKTGGFYLTLDQFSIINDLIMGVCYKQQSPEALELFAEQLQSKGRMVGGTRDVMSTLRGKRVKRPKYEDSDLKPVRSGRFQVFEVYRDQPINVFVENQGVNFRPGRGFYQLDRKSVDVQTYKEIILQHKDTGEVFNGDQVRRMLDLSPQTSTSTKTKERLRPTHFADWNVFIQSTSYNRKLIGGTKFMYEVDDWDRR